MQTLEYDHNVHHTPNAGDDSLLVKFFIDAAQDQKESEKQGRPVFKDVEWIDIRIPGNRDNIVIRPVRPEDKLRFPRHYAAFKNRVSGKEIIVGTPLHAWPYPGMTPARVKELEFYNIQTVEQLANTSDGTGAKLPGFQAMKQSAIAFLETAKQNAPVQALQKQINEMQLLIEKQAQIIDSLTADKATPGDKK